MIEQVHGVLLAPEDATYLLAALDVLVQDRNLSPKLADFVHRLRRTTEKLTHTTENTDVDVRKVDTQQNSDHVALYDLMDSTEAAAVLGCTPANVRDLARRGRLQHLRAGRRWLYPATSVVIFAEQRAAKQG